MIVRWIVIVLSAVVVFAAVGSQFVRGTVEEAPFTVVEEDGDFAVREYAPMTVARVAVSGTRDEAAEKGFEALSGYIFGDNRQQSEIAMTVPVLLAADASDAVSAAEASGVRTMILVPLLPTPEDDAWMVSFVLPDGLTPESAPRPVDPAIALETVPARRVAVVTFSGLAEAESVEAEGTRLLAWMETKGLATADPASIAYYDPPWTLPFLRRNEVLIPVGE